MMHSKPKKGIPFLSPSVSEVPIIGVVLSSPNPLELVECLTPHLRNYRVFLFVDGINEDLEARITKLGLYYTTDFNFFLMQVPQMSLALTFGALPHPAHLRVNLAISLFNELDIPVMDIQHGLFQWGVNFSDTSLRQGPDNQSGCALPMDTVADVQVTWTGPKGIGYPRYNDQIAEQSQSPQEQMVAPFVLVATNTNWHIYQEEERQRFKQILRHTFLSFPQVSFVWKAHPAENNPQLTSLHPLIEEARNDFANVEIARSVAQGGKTLTELTRECQAGISTVGTALLDFEMFRKPCLCFESRAVQELVASMPALETFKSLQMLQEKLPHLASSRAVPQTGQLSHFDPDRFRELVERTARRTQSKTALSACLNTIALTKQLMS